VGSEVPGQLVDQTGELRVLDQEGVDVAVVVDGFGLLEGGLALLADHDERR
jgi:hypothetical protein